MDQPRTCRPRSARISAMLLAAVAVAAAAAWAASGAPAGDADADKKIAAEVKAAPAVADEMKKEVITDAEPSDAPTGKPAPDAGTAAPPTHKPPGKPVGHGQREMTLEEIKDLPILKRYDEIPWEKGEELLKDVKDWTFDYDESAFWFLVRQVSAMPVERFEPDQEITAGYSQLLAMPSSFRGKPVTIRGAYMTVTPFRTPILAIRKDVPVLYECNLRELPLTEDRPVATVIVTQDPMTYLKVFDTVRVKGYFYKVRRYQGTKGEGFAPMLVAQRLVLEEHGAEGIREAPAGAGPWMPLVLMGALLVVMMVVLVYIRQRNKALIHASSARAVHRIRLRRPDRPPPFADGGSGGESGSPKP